MKTIKTFGLFAAIVTIAMALFGVSAAMGENTELCETDTETCSAQVYHLHYVASEMEILTGAIDYKCDALYLATTGELGAPQAIEGEFTYSNCNHSCSRSEVEGPVILLLLKTAHEKATLTGTPGAGVRSECPETLECIYSFEDLVGTVKGPLLAKSGNGELIYDHQPLTSTDGLLCPTTPKLDARFVLLNPAYVSS